MKHHISRIRTREAPVQGCFIEEEEVIFVNRTGHCYCCKRRVQAPSAKNDIHFRPINAKEGLFVCSKCDALYVLAESQTVTPAITKRQRTTKAEHLTPEEAECYICRKGIIDENKIQHRIKKLTASGSISSKDFQRIEVQERQRGWQYLSNNIYVHTRCKNGDKKYE